MDYSIFKALNFNMDGIEAALISYDVMCQWSVHMMERVTRSNYLKKPNNLELRLAIGLFHIHGHQDTCLPRYSPSFIEGARQIDGETIETLWAPLNEISRSTRGMTTSHRREVIDDHMNDSNWKKLINIGKFPSTDSASAAFAHTRRSVNAVSKRYQKALFGTAQSTAAFESINSSASPESIEAWIAEEERARKERAHDITVMDIYDIKMERRKYYLFMLVLLDVVVSVPSRSKILLELTEKEVRTSGNSGRAAWLSSGLKIQETQYGFGISPSDISDHDYAKLDYLFKHL